MRIRIHTNSCHLNLRIPDKLLYNSITRNMIEKEIRKNTNIQWTMDEELLKKVMKLLKQFSKEYKGLTVVDVETAKGERVQITM